jgi:nitroreductase
MTRPSWPTVSALSDGILVRTSRRAYEPDRAVEAAKLEQLERLAEEFRPWPGARFVVVREAPPELFTGLIGSYGRVSGAPSAFVFVGIEGTPGVDAAIGYVGEMAVLAATTVGLGTCWIAGSFDQGVAKDLIEIGPTERVYGVSPLGYAKGKGGDALFSGWRTLHPRKPLTTIAPGCETWPSWARAAVEAGRLAPSAINRQPWRFSFEPDRGLVASVVSGGSGTLAPELDVGIAMLQCEVAATAAGCPSSWVFSDRPSVVAEYSGS